MPAVTNRAERRIAARNAKARTRRTHYWAANPRQLGRYARTPHPCSCPSCGNQRPHVGPTLQEIRNTPSIDTEVAEYHNWYINPEFGDWAWDMLRAVRDSDQYDGADPTPQEVLDVLHNSGVKLTPVTYYECERLIKTARNHVHSGRDLWSLCEEFLAKYYAGVLHTPPGDYDGFGQFFGDWAYWPDDPQWDDFEDEYDVYPYD